MKARRCLIPADGFYEWEKVGKSKRCRIGSIGRIRGHLPSLGYGNDVQKSIRRLNSCTILTTSPNALLDKYHDRMPVILSPNDYGKWIDPVNKDPESLRYLFEPSPADELIDTPVNPVMNNALHKRPVY